MARTIGIENQDFEMVRGRGYFYIDKTDFIREWRESGFGRYDVMPEPGNPSANLAAKGIPEAHIRKYGFAFCGKRC